MVRGLDQVDGLDHHPSTSRASTSHGAIADNGLVNRQGLDRLDGGGRLGQTDAQSARVERQSPMIDRQTIEMALTKVGQLEKRVRLLLRVTAALGLCCFVLFLVVVLIVARSNSNLQSRINRIEQSIATGVPFPAKAERALMAESRDDGDATEGPRARQAGRAAGIVKAIAAASDVQDLKQEVADLKRQNGEVIQVLQAVLKHLCTLWDDRDQTNPFRDAIERLDSLP